MIPGGRRFKLQEGDKFLFRDEDIVEDDLASVRRSFCQLQDMESIVGRIASGKMNRVKALELEPLEVRQPAAVRLRL